MATELGIIYLTSNGGYNWRSAVQETVSATVNKPGTIGIAPGKALYPGLLHL